MGIAADTVVEHLAIEVKQLLDEGQWFLAYDAAQAALAQSPDDLKLQQYAARALLNLGAAEDAKKLLEPLCQPLDADDPQFVQLFNQVRTAAGHLLRAPSTGSPSTESLAAFAELLDAVGKSRGRLAAARTTDEETLGLLARAYKETWKESGRVEDARRCRDLYLRAFRQTGGTWSCVNAASMSWAVGEMESADGGDASRCDAGRKEKAMARELAEKALDLADRQIGSAQGETKFWLLASRGEALLHLGRESEAAAAYAQAAEPMMDDSLRVSAAAQLRLLKRWGFPVPDGILQCLKLPVVAVFVGHMMDRPDRPAPRFPPELEPEVRRRIDHTLAELDVKIGYSMPACGSDILFIEAMQDRDADVNIVVPFDAEDFIHTSVGFAGHQWVRRFRRALKLAGSRVTYATTERYLGTSDLFNYADRILHGLALLRARSLGTEPYLVAVYDGTSPTLKGGSADIIDRWPAKDRMRVIELPKPAAHRAASSPANAPAAPAPQAAAPQAAAPAPPPMPANQTPPPPKAHRVVRTMLFADVVGFSKLHEDQVPYFMYSFLNEVARHLRVLPQQPLLLNTWGDAIFAVMDQALPMVKYARTLQQVVCSMDWEKLGLPGEMSVRIGLHAGPVFEGIDAITGRPNYFGSHVNQAARIEPVTVPGHVYASQQFVALLTSEQRAMGPEAAREKMFACDYLGRLNLAKNFGILPVYRIRSLYARSVPALPL